MNIGETYDLHFNESKFGSGHRSFTITKIGHKWISGVDPSTLITGKLILSEWDAHKPRLM
jgi:hypothetical protein